MPLVLDVAHALADLLRAIAWPGVALILVLRYKDQVGRLIDRLRKGGPAEFDPLPSPQTKPLEALPTQAGTGPNALAHLRTPAVLAMEAELRQQPVLAAEPDPAKREAALAMLLAKAVLLAMYERADAVMYASQIDLLNYLNAAANGELPDRLKQLFYDPAAARYPDLYRNHPFENYLGFLQGSRFVAVGLRVTITAEGREYLLWRVEQGKLPRPIG